MDMVLWLVQGILAAMFLMAGIMKVTSTKQELIAKNMGWAEDVSDNLIKIIGTSEILGAIGLIAPWATGILPWLTPLAAICIGVVLVFAAITHMRRGEFPMIVMNLMLMAMAVFILWGRLSALTNMM